MAFLTMQDNTQIYYNDWGTGAPVLLIHGWPLTSASWEYQARFLAENGCRVITYDRRGFGRSDWAFSGYNYEVLTDDLKQLVDHLDLKELTLVGFSMGGGEVARYIGQHNHAKRVVKAVLIASVTPYLLKTNDNPHGLDAQVFTGIIDQLSKDRPAFLKEFSQKFYNRTLINHTVSEETLQFFQYMALSGSPKATIELVRAWSETDFRDDLKQFNLPTLMIHGNKDATVPIESSAHPATYLIPNVELKEYEGAPHGLNVTAYQQLNEDLLHFIAPKKEE